MRKVVFLLVSFLFFVSGFAKKLETRSEAELEQIASLGVDPVDIPSSWSLEKYIGVLQGEEHSIKQHILFYMAINSGEPFMDIAVDYEINKLKENCNYLSSNFIALNLKPNQSKNNLILCLKGELSLKSAPEFSSGDISKDWLKKTIQETIRSLVKEPLKYRFSFHIKSHGYKDYGIVFPSAISIHEKNEQQKSSINKYRKENPSVSLIDVVRAESKRVDQEIAEELIAKQGLGHKELGAKELGDGPSVVSKIHEGDIEKVFWQLKNDFHISLWYMESCREKADRMLRGQDDLTKKSLHASQSNGYRRAPGAQAYSSLNWDQAMPPNKILEAGLDDNIKQLGQSKFYESEMQGVLLIRNMLNLEYYQKMQVYRLLKEAFSPVEDSRVFHGKARARGLEKAMSESSLVMDEEKNYPSVLSQFNIDSFFEKTSLDSGEYKILQNDKLLRFKNYVLKLLQEKSFSSFHKSFYESSSINARFNSDEERTRFHIKLSLLAKEVLGERIFDENLHGRRIHDYDASRYLYAPFAMLILLELGEKALEIFDFPENYQASLTSFQNQVGIRFTTRGLLYLKGDAKIQSEEQAFALGLSGPNYGFFFRSALLKEDSYFIDFSLQKILHRAEAWAHLVHGASFLRNVIGNQIEVFVTKGSSYQASKHEMMYLAKLQEREEPGKVPKTISFEEDIPPAYARQLRWDSHFRDQIYQPFLPLVKWMDFFGAMISRGLPPMAVLEYDFVSANSTKYSSIPASFLVSVFMATSIAKQNLRENTAVEALRFHRSLEHAKTTQWSDNIKFREKALNLFGDFVKFNELGDFDVFMQNYLDVYNRIVKVCTHHADCVMELVQKKINPFIHRDKFDAYLAARAVEDPTHYGFIRSGDNFKSYYQCPYKYTNLDARFWRILGGADTENLIGQSYDLMSKYPDTPEAIKSINDKHCFEAHDPGRYFESRESYLKH